MDKIIFCNLDLLRNGFTPELLNEITWTSSDTERHKKEYERFRENAQRLVENSTETSGNEVVFYSRNSNSVKEAEDVYKKKGITWFKFTERSKVENFITDNRDKNHYFVVIGRKNKDFELAVNSRSLYIVPTWLPLEDKPQKYGVHVDTADQLYKFILTLNNQSAWYSTLIVDPITTCYSLMDARYGYYARDAKEKEMIQNFQNLLKNGQSRNYYEILLYHFLAGMTNHPEFDDIELFGMIPSSDCRVNKDLFSFMTAFRCLKGKRLPHNYLLQRSEEEQNLLLRSKPKQQAHIAHPASVRESLGGNDEFATLCINPEFKEKISKLRRNGKLNVCIFDDYMTYGNTFNAVRNILHRMKANKIILVSLGRFDKPFQKRDYSITGSLYELGYETTEKAHTSLYNFVIDDKAKEEVSDLYDIFNS